MPSGGRGEVHSVATDASIAYRDATALTVGLGALAASHAIQVVNADAPFARTSLGSGLWLLWLLMGLVLADALQALRATALARLGVATAALLPLALLLASGGADELSIMKEYANRSDEYWGAIARHVQIVALALLFTLAIGLPLGWATHRYARASKALFPLLNIIQTIPSIALFGLLMAPLAWLAASWPALGRAGISGVGEKKLQAYGAEILRILDAPPPAPG